MNRINFALRQLGLWLISLIAVTALSGCGGGDAPAAIEPTIPPLSVAGGSHMTELKYVKISIDERDRRHSPRPSQRLGIEHHRSWWRALVGRPSVQVVYVVAAPSAYSTPFAARWFYPSQLRQFKPADIPKINWPDLPEGPLIEAGAEVDVVDAGGLTALIRAAWRGYGEIVKALNGGGADVNKVGGDGGTALVGAAKFSRTEMAKVLVEAGVDVNQVDEDGETPLMWAAARWGHANTAKVLIEMGADVNQVNVNRETPLLAAAGYGHTEVVKVLIEAGADVNVADRDGETALLRALMWGHGEIVKVLIEAGADVNVVDGDGEAALLRALKVLIEAGAVAAPSNAQGMGL